MIIKKSASRLLGIGALMLTIPMPAALAQDNQPNSAYRVQITKEKPYVRVIHDNKDVRVRRNQDADYRLEGYFAMTGRNCPPACLNPMSPVEGVQAVGEVEIFNFMENEIRNGTGLLVDSRTDPWWMKGTIPGAVHYPYTTMTYEPDAPEMRSLLMKMGAQPRDDVGVLEKGLEGLGLVDGEQKTEHWDFTNAKKLILFCNGPSCGQSPRALQALVDAGYPPSKLFYYRGGMRMWQMWGLTTVMPKEP